jgi:ligand-binding sensor domain-containing protein
MKVKSFHQRIFILWYIPLLAVTIACNSQSQPQQGKQGVPAVAGSQRLKFTTGVRSILEDSKGNIWFGSYNEGVCLLQNGELHYFTTQNGLSDNQVRSIYEDKNGVIWLECGVGLSVYSDGRMTVFHERHYEAPTALQLSDDDLWFKSDASFGYSNAEKKSGVYQYDGKALYYRTVTVTDSAGQEMPWAKSTGFVRSKNGTIWFGAYGVLIGHDGRQWITITNASAGLNGTTENLHIRALMEDSKGNLWIGNNCGGGNSGIGVIRYDGKSFLHFSKQQRVRTEDTRGNSLDKVFSIGEDSAGNIWFGTNESGVWRYDGHRLKNFTKVDGVDSGITWVIYKSKAGELWIGGGPNGVYRFNGQSFERIY